MVSWGPQFAINWCKSGALLELMEIRCARGERHPLRLALVEDNLVGREDRWTDRPCAPLREGGQRDGPHDRSAGKRFGASVRAGHRRSCNPAAFQKAPISAHSVISKFLPPVQSNFFEPSWLQRSTEKQERSGFLLSGGSKSPKPAFFFKNPMAFHLSPVVWQDRPHLRFLNVTPAMSPVSFARCKAELGDALNM